MSKLSVETYHELVRRSGLVNEPQLKQAVVELRKQAAGKPLSAEMLAKKLLDSNLITNWQNDKLMQGKHQGFMLGKYKLLKHLSSGGMSSVYLGEHTKMNRLVAIKVLPPARVEDSSYLPRFQRECRVMASLDHPNIVRAHDFDVEGKLHYLVLEFIDGPDLQQLVDRDGPLPFEKAADYIRQAADGLAHAHTMNMVHRDMKPANLMVDKKGSLRVLDLGVARITGADEGPSLTLAHNEDVLGTADFLAPEQAINSHHVDSRADIYALGCTFYFLLAGRVPFKEANLAKKLMAHQMIEPPSLTQFRPDTPEPLVKICQQMMVKQADDRYQTMEEVSRDLSAWLSQVGAAVSTGPKADEAPLADLPPLVPGPSSGKGSTITTKAGNKSTTTNLAAAANPTAAAKQDADFELADLVESEPAATVASAAPPLEFALEDLSSAAAPASTASPRANTPPPPAPAADDDREFSLADQEPLAKPAPLPGVPPIDDEPDSADLREFGLTKADLPKNIPAAPEPPPPAPAPAAPSKTLPGMSADKSKSSSTSSSRAKSGSKLDPAAKVTPSKVMPKSESAAEAAKTVDPDLAEFGLTDDFFSEDPSKAAPKSVPNMLSLKDIQEGKLPGMDGPLAGSGSSSSAKSTGPTSAGPTSKGKLNVKEIERGPKSTSMEAIKKTEEAREKLLAKEQAEASEAAPGTATAEREPSRQKEKEKGKPAPAGKGSQSSPGMWYAAIGVCAVGVPLIIFCVLFLVGYFDVPPPAIVESTSPPIEAPVGPSVNPTAVPVPTAIVEPTMIEPVTPLPPMPLPENTPSPAMPQRPESVAAWQFPADYLGAAYEGDRRLVEAVKGLIAQRGNDDLVDQMLVKMLQPADLKAPAGSAVTSPGLLQPEVMQLVLTHFTASKTPTAGRTLSQILKGQMTLGPADTEAVKLVLEPVLAEANEANRKLIGDILGDATFRRANSGPLKPEDLRRQVFEALRAQATPAMRLELAQRWVDGKLVPDLRPQVEQWLLTNQVENLPAQVLFYVARKGDDAQRDNLEMLLAPPAKLTIATLLGVGSDPAVAATAPTPLTFAAASQVASLVWTKEFVDEVWSRLRPQTDNNKRKLELSLLTNVPLPAARSRVQTLMLEYKDDYDIFADTFLGLPKRALVGTPTVTPRFGETWFDPGLWAAVKTLDRVPFRPGAMEKEPKTLNPKHHWFAASDEFLQVLLGRCAQGAAQQAAGKLSQRTLPGTQWLNPPTGLELFAPWTAQTALLQAPIPANKKKQPLELHPGAKVTAELFLDWPAQLTATAPNLTMDPLVLHYVRIEQAEVYDRVGDFYADQLKTSVKRYFGDKGFAIDSKGKDLRRWYEAKPILENDREFSLDMVITRLRPDPKQSRSAAEDLLIEILWIGQAPISKAMP